MRIPPAPSRSDALSKFRLIALAPVLLALCLVAVPATGQTFYSNGAINGSADAWTINFGFVVSDSFTTTGGVVMSLEFGAWTFPGDVLENAEVQVTSSEFGGTTFFSTTAFFTQSGCSANQYGFNVRMETASFNTLNLAAGTYWLNLDNAVVNDGDPTYWDENSGPSLASQNAVGTIPSKSFTILGEVSPPQSSPEPSSILLFGSGILGAAGVLRRKLFEL